MHSSYLFRGFMMPLLLSSSIWLSACGGGSGTSAQGDATPQTAPAIAVEPQSNFNNGGSVDTAKIQTVQDNYLKKLEMTK